MKLYSRLLILSLYVPLAPVACAQSPAMSGMSGQTTVSQSSQFQDAPITRAELDQLLAPVALYPDTVLTHVLIAATYPLEVVHAHRWAQGHKHLNADAAREAVEREDWDPSVKALVAFPELLSRMGEDLTWTETIGDAFLADEAMVMDAIQALRQHAYDRGSLEQMQHLRVERVEKTIVIEPAVERVVYIPYYDTRVVYGPWWWSDHPPVYWRYPQDHIYIGGHYWGQRAYLGSSFFFASFQWPQRRVVHIHHHHPKSFHSARRIATYKDARHWRHDPIHRRGVAYRHKVVRQRFDQHPNYLRNHTARERLEDRRRNDRPGKYLPAPERKADRTVFRGSTGERPPRKADAVISERRQEERTRVRRTGDRSEPREIREVRETQARERHQRRDAGDGKLHLRKAATPRQESSQGSAVQPKAEPAARPARSEWRTERPARAERPASRPERPASRIERAAPQERSSPRAERPSPRVERPSPRAERPSPRVERQARPQAHERGSSVRFHRPQREER